MSLTLFSVLNRHRIKVFNEERRGPVTQSSWQLARFSHTPRRKTAKHAAGVTIS